jgi:outer membrane receptor for ferrienterochelin and colicins
MKKYILSVMLIITACFSLKAQTSDVQINVITATENEPLLGATVYFEKLEKGAITDSDGIANFTEIPNGQHIITISYLGYETLKTSILTPSVTPLLFKLTTDHDQELDEVVVQSSRSTRTVRKIPTRIEFIGGEELGEKAAMNPTNISKVQEYKCSKLP